MVTTKKMTEKELIDMELHEMSYLGICNIFRMDL